MSVPAVDVVIAVHDLSRPVGRAVRSVLEGADGAARVTVVCHELTAESVAGVLPPELRAQVRLLEVADGTRSPAGPFNAGLDAAEAPFVAVMGSDDLLETGAVPAWLRAAAGGADVVLAPMRHQSGETIPTPRTRLGRSRRLDLVKDRLAYRTAPLGLLRRSVLDDHGIRFTTGLRVGEDVAFSMRLWTLPLRVDLAAGAPRYVVGADAGVRVSTTLRPVQDELAAYDHLLDQSWFRQLPAPERRAVAVKTLRIHVLHAARRRPEPALWRPGEAAWLAAHTRRWTELAPGVLRPFSRADRDLVDAILAPGADEPRLAAASAERAAAGRWEIVLTRRVAGNLDRESVLRHYLALRVRR